MRDYQKIINWFKSLFPVFDEELARLKPVPTEIEVLREMIDSTYRKANEWAKKGEAGIAHGLIHNAREYKDELKVLEEAEK